MSRWSRVLLLVVAMLPTWAAAQTRIDIPSSALEAPDGAEADRISVSGDANERERLREMVTEWRTYVQEGNVADAADVISQMQQLMALDAVKDGRTILAAFVAAGHDWAASGFWDLAERAYKAALDLDPDYGPARLGLAEMVKKRDGGLRGNVGLATGVVQSLKSKISDPMGLLAVVANVLLIGIVSLAVAVAGISVVLLVRGNRLLRHGVQEALGQRVPEGIDGVIAWGFVLLPMMLFLSPAWWVLWWLALLSGYAPPALRRLAMLALLVAALLPIAFHATSRISSLQGGSVVRARTALLRHDVAPRDIDAINELAARTRSAPAAFLLAKLESAAGRQDDAVESYSKVVDLAPSDARAIVNRANIHFRRGDLPQAITDYKLAIDRDPTLAIARRNGSIAFAQNLKADIAGQWMAEAQKLDRGAVQDWNSEVGPDRVVDADLTSRETLDLILIKDAEPTPPAWHALLSPLSIGAVVAFLFAMYRARRGLGVLAARSCEKCGRAFCARCHAASKGTAYCTQCVHLYVKKDGVSPVVRAAKLREVERHVTINSIAVRVFNLLLPGAGSLYANRIISGSLTLLAWGATLAALLLPARMVMDPQRLGHADLTVLFAVELALLVVVYLVALTQSLRHSG